MPKIRHHNIESSPIYFFDQCVYVFARPNGQLNMEVKAPDTITSWVASAFAVSPSAGLGVAPVTAKV